MEAPRINASMLPKYSGKIVCLVGNVTEVSCDIRFAELALSFAMRYLVANLLFLSFSLQRRRF